MELAALGGRGSSKDFYHIDAVSKIFIDQDLKQMPKWFVHLYECGFKMSPQVWFQTLHKQQSKRG